MYHDANSTPSNKNIFYLLEGRVHGGDADWASRLAWQLHIEQKGAWCSSPHCRDKHEQTNYKMTNSTIHSSYSSSFEKWPIYKLKDVPPGEDKQNTVWDLDPKAYTGEGT